MYVARRRESSSRIRRIYVKLAFIPWQIYWNPQTHSHVRDNWIRALSNEERPNLNTSPIFVNRTSDVNEVLTCDFSVSRIQTLSLSDVLSANAGPLG